MKKQTSKRLLQSLAVLLLLTFGTSNLMAGPEGAGHSHAESRAKLTASAKKTLSKLIQDGKVDKSWKDATFMGVQKKGNEFIVTFNNKMIKDSTKQNLYVYLTSYAKVIGSTYKKSN